MAQLMRNGVKPMRRSPFTSTLYQALNAGIAVCILVALIVAANYQHGVFGPILIQTLLLAGVTYAVGTRRIGQLFDIFAPNSAAEAGFLRKQFVLGKTHYTFNWLLNLTITLMSWLLLFYILWQIALNQAGHVEALPALQPGSNALHVPHSERPNLIRFLDGDSDDYRIRFIRLTLWTWLIWWLPCGFAITSLWITQRFNPKHPEKVDYHGMALLVICATLGTLSLSLAELWLGLNTGIGGGITLFALIPILLLIVRLFSPWRWTEGGKGILNVSCECRINPLPTLDFLQVPAAAAESLATRGRSQTTVHREPNHPGPVILLCASGGGSRAALFTAGILNRMWWQNTPEGFFTSEEEGTLQQAAQSLFQTSEQERPSESNGLTPVDQAHNYPGRLLLQCADAISSVSGGSLASAYFVESLHRTLRDHLSVRDSVWGRWVALNAFFDPQALSPEEARPLTTWYTTICQPSSLQAFFHCRDTRMVMPQISTSEEFQRNYEANPFINAMAQDHLAACISGFFIWRTRFDHDRDAAHPRAHEPFRMPCYPLGRGPNIERFWEQRFSWYRDGKLTGTSEGHPVRLHDFYAKEQSGHLPSLVLNATLAGTGTRLAITNLDNTTFQESRKFGPVVDARDLGEGDALNIAGAGTSDQHIGKGREASGHLPHDPEASQRQAAHRFDPLPAQINTLNSLDNLWDITLKSATRASANFPIGFPLMRFRRYKVNPDGSAGDAVTKQDGTPDILDICDGGLLDNTGVDTVMALLRANRDEIRKRGVLIFQIDSGELPRNPGLSLLDTVLYNLSAVRNGMWRTNLNTQAALHSEYLDELRALFEDDLEEKRHGEKGLKSLRRVVGTMADGEKYTLGFEGNNAAFYVVRAGELSQEHVMTSWHLDAGQRALLHDEVLQRQQGEAILRASQWFAQRLLDKSLSPS